ncbi:hypothetical protein CBER1_10749 [Cercospora berteroae]|uniref:Uncharacterized protein n=1 Tax=Cercospora berteroae TaxID=357750 RepID=A0A2S6CN65_9PEZI|nr:hypothetical protein CBER1_10749 [Cercospora berteroae]
MLFSIWALSVLPKVFATTAPTLTGFEKNVHWEPCLDPKIPIFCANLSLPVDWNKPDGEHFDLFMSKIAAKKQDAKIGNLFFNPGGPGASPGKELQKSDIAPYSYNYWNHNPLTDHFDFIAIDPRGTGNSRPVLCDPKVWRKETRYFPQTEDEFHRLKSQLEAMGQSCYNQTGDWLRYIDTASSAKDIEAVRIALGDEPMSFLGISYGTQLGAQYAELFPGNIRAMVLDSVLDHSELDPFDSWVRESAGYEEFAEGFFDWCEGAGSSCVLSGVDNLPAWFDNLVDRLNEQPIEFLSPEPCDGDPIDCGNRLYGDKVTGKLAGFIASPNAGPTWQETASHLAMLESRGTPGRFQETRRHEGNSSQTWSFVAILCADAISDQTKPDYATIRERVEYARSTFPHTRGNNGSWTRLMFCPFWPVPSNNPPHEITAFKDGTSKFATPILIVNAYQDPLTRYDAAINVQRQFGDANAVLLSRDGFGHISESFPGAVSDAIYDYLINLKVPAHGTVLKNLGL